VKLIWRHGNCARRFGIKVLNSNQNAKNINILGNIEAEATLLVPIPTPYGGLVVVGQQSISYQKVSTKIIG